MSIDGIRERCEKATKGPWIWTNNWDFIKLYKGYKPKQRIPNTKDNNDFIAHAREDIPTLLTEIDRLETENKRLVTGHNEYNRVNQLLVTDNERLRDALEPMVRERDKCFEDGETAKRLNGFYSLEFKKDVTYKSLSSEVGLLAAFTKAELEAAHEASEETT